MGYIQFFSEILTHNFFIYHLALLQYCDIRSDLKLADPTYTLWCFYCQNITFHNSVHFSCAHLWLCHFPEWCFISASIKEFGFFMWKLTYWDRRLWRSGFHHRTPLRAGAAPFHPRRHQSCPGLSLWTGTTGRAGKKGRQEQVIFHSQMKQEIKMGLPLMDTVVFHLHEPPAIANKNIALKLQSLQSRCHLSKWSVPKLRFTLVVTCTGIHPSLSLKYSPLRSFLNTSALTTCTRSISSSLFTTNIYTHPHMRAAESRTRGWFAIETYIRFGFIRARSYCRDFIQRAPVCVASKGSIVGDLGITFAVTWRAWKSHFPLFPNWKKTCKMKRAWKQTTRCSVTVRNCVTPQTIIR